MRTIEPRALMEQDCHLPVTDCMLFFTTGTSTISKLIKRVAGEPTHVGLLFLRLDGWQYMEALIGRDIQAPESIARLCAWPHRQPGREAYAVPLPNMTSKIAQSIYLDCLEDVGRCTYNPAQLVALWAAIRLGFDMPVSPGKVICSEWAGRKVHPHVELRPTGQKSWDRLTPEQIRHATLQMTGVKYDLSKGAPV